MTATKRRAPGRPSKDPDERYSRRVEVKVTPEMYEQITGATNNFSDWGREAFATFLAAEKQPELPPDALTIHIAPERQEQLRTFIRPFGFRALEHFIEDMALRTLDKSPRAVQEYLLGDVLQVGDDAAAKERARLQAIAEEKRKGKAA